MAYRGSCLCKKISYEIQKFQPAMGQCHCTMCRKFHGAAFSTFGRVLLEDLKWLSGEENLKSYKAENGTVRKFCETCGSSLTFQSVDDLGRAIEIALGTLDDPIPHRPDSEIYLDDKADWYELDADLPKFKQGRE